MFWRHSFAAPGPAASLDDTLQLYFLCVHPSLSPASAVALTLRAVGGLTTRQIAQAYLVPEATMAQRISRAKRTVNEVRLDCPGNLRTVLRVLYLVFNEGYSGDVDLAAEAIRLARQLTTSTHDAEVAGLLALFLLHHARRPARTRGDGSLVPPSDQDRNLWRRDLIIEGVTVLPCTPIRQPPTRPIGYRSSSGTTGSAPIHGGRHTSPQPGRAQPPDAPSGRPGPATRWRWLACTSERIGHDNP